MVHSFCLIGGDARQLALADLLTRDGCRVLPLALSDAPTDLSRAAGADCVLLPLPLERTPGLLSAPLCPQSIPLERVFATLRPEQHIFGGKISKHAQLLAQQQGLTIRDYLQRDELAIANAVPTAEGALAAAMEALPFTIHQSRVLIVGFGRVGQCTALRFRALGADVSVAARSPGQLALARSLGCQPLPLGTATGDFDLIINTVPAVILTRDKLEHLGHPILLELASPPGGFDREAASQLGLRLIPAPNLPGKVAPVTAARAIQQTLYHMLEELHA